MSVATIRTSQVLCELGHYCVDGELLQCPVGYYGDRRGLATESCTERCNSSYYCGKASITPIICPKGSDHYR
jgi:hypothetical protein